eukprot:gene25601-1710_t
MTLIITEVTPSSSETTAEVECIEVDQGDLPPVTVVPNYQDVQPVISTKTNEELRCLATYSKFMAGTYTMSAWTYMEQFLDWEKLFAIHVWKQKCASAAMRACEDICRHDPNKVMLVIDQSENMKGDCAYESAATHFTGTKLSLFNAAVIRMSGCTSYNSFSPDLEHDSVATFSALEGVLEEEQLEGKDVYFWSDGSPKEYKTNEHCRMIASFVKKYKLKSLQYNFLVAYHGKGYIDSLGHRVKSIVKRTVIGRSLKTWSLEDMRLSLECEHGKPTKTAGVKFNDYVYKIHSPERTDEFVEFLKKKREATPEERKKLKRPKIKFGEINPNWTMNGISVQNQWFFTGELVRYRKVVCCCKQGCADGNFEKCSRKNEVDKMSKPENTRVKK